MAVPRCCCSPSSAALSCADGRQPRHLPSFQSPFGSAGKIVAVNSLNGLDRNFRPLPGSHDVHGGLTAAHRNAVSGWNNDWRIKRIRVINLASTKPKFVKWFEAGHITCVKLRAAQKPDWRAGVTDILALCVSRIVRKCSSLNNDIICPRSRSCLPRRHSRCYFSNDKIFRAGGGIPKLR
jgi:hypothetical protein